jgi:hypothetical protein
MPHLLPTLAVLTLSLSAAAPVDPFAGGVTIAKVKSVIGYTIPPSAGVGRAVVAHQEIPLKSLFKPNATTCVAAHSPAARQETSAAVRSSVYVLTRASATSPLYQVHLFSVESAPKEHPKLSAALTAAVTGSKRCP